MANRSTRLIIKNSDIVNRPLPNSLLGGEAIVNTADGIMWFSGVTTSTTEWTPAGTGSTANFFEVGSNLYDLRLRNKITAYQDISGAGLVGKFLSGTSTGFVLADISDISGIDTYVTGGTITYTGADGSLVLRLNETAQDVTISGFSNIYTTGATFVGSTAYFDTNDTLSAYTLDLSAFVPTGDTYVTGFTYNGANTFTIEQSQGQPDLTATFNTVTGLTVNGTLSATTLDANNILSGGTNLSTIFSTTDYFTTGFTYTPSTNTLTIDVSDGNSYTASINSVSGLTVANLSSGRVVYTSTGGLLTDEAGFEYNAGTDTLTVANITATNDVTINGDLTVLGAAISAFTSELYIEDNNITLNFNPTGATNVTSVNSGFVIQDGNGVSGDVSFNIVRMQNLTGLTGTQIPSVAEYTTSTGYVNRGWITELNDIVIRSTDTNDNGGAGAVNGVRVLAEFDVLDGGTY
jgi:hypothetical protein